ncbi:hypothetical protein TNCV_231341 [Trichonephila clavipes]|nr:hypothetical protein TNCV_231341 [Trichonephila clavipes]
MATMVIGCNITPDDSADVVGSKAVVLKAAMIIIPLEQFRPAEQSSDLASHFCILAFQSFHFVDKFLRATIAARIFAQLCLNVAGDDLLLAQNKTEYGNNRTIQPIREQSLSSQPSQKLFQTHHPDEAPKPRLPDPIDHPIAVMPPSRM